MFLNRRIAWVMHLASFVIHGSLPVNACYISSTPENDSKTVGETQNLNCGACSTTSNRNVSFTWEYHNEYSTYPPPVLKVVQGCSSLGFPFCHDSGRRFRFCHSQIMLSNINLKHRGTYTCKATCDRGQTDSASAYVRVKGPPLFLNPPSDRNVSLGEDVSLSCKIESDPAANINWFVVWTNQDAGDLRTLISSETTDVYPTGEYITTSITKVTGITQGCQIFCTASNRFGAVNSTVAVINIKEVPEMVKGVTASDVRATSIMLSWALGFDGYAPIVAAHIKWQPAAILMANDTQDNDARVVNATTTDSYLISGLHPATLYEMRVAVSNDQGVSNWSEPYQVKTNYTVPPAPEQVIADCFDDEVDISWTPIPYDREHGQVSKYVVTVQDMATNHETIKKTKTNHTLVRIDPRTSLGSNYIISVCGVTKGGEGPTRRIIYQCIPRNKTHDGPVSLTTEILTSNANSTALSNETSHEYTAGTIDTFTIKEEATVIVILPPEELAAVAQSVDTKHQPVEFHKHILFVPLSVVGVILLGILVVFAYNHHLKKKHRNIQLNVAPYMAYIENDDQRDATNEASVQQSHDPSNPAVRWSRSNPYQTHIVNLEAGQLQQASGYSLGDTSDKRRLLRMPSEEYDYENCAADFAHQIHLDEESKTHFYKSLIPIQQVTTGVIVGEGEFGEVSFGYLNEGSNNQVKVAIKKMKDITDSRAYETFIKEGVITMAFDHRNVLAIIGISLDEDISGCIVPLVLMPFMENGDLRAYLYNARVSQKMLIPVYQLVGFMLDIAAGMEYLASKNFVHRDLAARNCMLDSKFNVKIADFGLTRKVCGGADYYKICKNGKSCKIPVKWVAIESLRDGKFTISSDVWACGVTMWEIITQSQIPYPGLSNCSVYQHLLEGHRLKQPPGCPTELYSIMYSCWEAEEKKRPSFLALKESLLDLLLEWKKIDIDMEVESQGDYCSA